MGSEQSLLKVVASAKKRQDTALIFRGDIIDPKWIPEDDLLQMKLETLKLIDMRFVTVPPIMLQLLSIKQLDLSSNMLVSVTGIGALANLTDLDLSGNHLDYLPDDLANCKNLSFLNVSQNMLNIRSLPLSFFDGKHFSSLDISENKFTKMTPELITLLDLAESVSIHSNPWDIAELKDVEPSSSEEHVKTLLMMLKSTILTPGLGMSGPAVTTSLSNDPNSRKSVSLQKEKSGISVQESFSDHPNAGSSTTIKTKDSITKRVSVGFGKAKKESADLGQTESTFLKDPELQENLKEAASPPSIPPSRSDMVKLSTSPPPVASRSPAAVAPSRTQVALKTPTRPAGPKGRKLPTNDFIDNNAYEDEIEVVSKPKEVVSKVTKPEAFLPSVVYQTDANPPVVPSKLSRPASSSVPISTLSSTEEENVTARESILAKESILMREASIKKEINGKEKDAFKQDLKDQIAPLPSPKLPKKNLSTLTSNSRQASNLKTGDVDQFAIGTSPVEIEFPEPLKRQATLTESSKFEAITPEQVEVPIKKSGPKKPVGGVSLFGGAIMPLNDDASKKSPEGPAVPPKKSEVHVKEISGVQAKIPDIPVKEKPDANSISSSPKISKKHEFSLNPSNTSVTGKKPPIGGVSMFGPPHMSGTVNAENNKAEIKEENQTGSVKEALNSREVTSPSSKKVSIFSMFNISPSSPTNTESKEIVKKDVLPNGSSTQQTMSKKFEISSQPQPNTVSPSPTKKSPAGRFSMLGGPPIPSDSPKKEANEAQGTATWKKPQPGGAGSMLDKQNTDVNLESELRGRLKQQLSIVSQIDSSSAPIPNQKPSGTTLPRSFKPSDADHGISVPPLPSKPSAAKSIDKLTSK